MFKLEDGTGYADSSSYSTVAEADAHIYFFYPEDVEWIAKTQAQKELALIVATKFIDRLVDWSSTILLSTQALQWPRAAFSDSDGRTIEDGTIPQKVKEAVIEVARQSLTEDIYDNGVLITSQKYGSSSETYAGPVRDGGNPTVRYWLKEFQKFGYGSSSSVVTLYRA